MKNNKLSDTQNIKDERGKKIHLVGISDLNYPFCFQDDGVRKEIMANFKLGVNLPSNQKGTHMSRFIEVLNTNLKTNWSIETFDDLARQVSKELESEKSRIQIDFTWFIKKYAPISQTMSLLDYQISLIATHHSSKPSDSNNSKKQIKITVPVKSLCPCSKSISDYGAHNQRSYVSVWIDPTDDVNDSAHPFNLTEIIKIVEKNSSAELYPILKRVDEKYITEYAYDHALFVEDTIRDVALALENNQAIKEYQVYSENIESIHNHSAFAMLQSAEFKAL